MRHTGFATVCVMGLLAGMAVPALGQGAGGSGREAVGTTGRAAPAPVDVNKLPIDMSRIRRRLDRVNVREERDGLSLRYMIDVFAQAPAIELFPSSRLDPNFWTGPTPYGAPTHREFLNLNTPIEHRGSVANIGALGRWLADKSSGDKKTTRK